MHSDLHRPDGAEDVAADEVREVTAELVQGDGPEPTLRLTTVALIFLYEAARMIDTQPQGDTFVYLDLVFAFYSALRRAGLKIDVVARDADLTNYAMIVVPTLPIITDRFGDRLAALPCPVLMGPRTCSKTADFSIPAELPRHLPLKVIRVESRRGAPRWIEHVETALPLVGGTYRHENLRYMPMWPDSTELDKVVAAMAREAALATMDLPRDIRLSRLGDRLFVFNYGPEPVDFGGETLPPAGVAIWGVDNQGG